MERFMCWLASLFQKRGQSGLIVNYGVGNKSVAKHAIIDPKASFYRR